MRIPFKACPICATPAFDVLRSADCSRHALYDPRLPNLLIWMQCEHCAHVFTDSYFSPAGAKILFSRAHAFQQLSADAYERQRLVAARIVERVAWFQAPRAHWLDVGFGDGALLRTAEEFGFIPVGVDVRAGAVEALGRNGVEAHACDFADFHDERRFAVVSMMDTLEHMPFPRQALERARKLIACGGMLVVSMPNSDSPIFRQLTAAGTNPYWAEIEHLHNFGRAELYQLLAETGFTPYRYAVSERYRAGMEILARPTDAVL